MKYEAVFGDQKRFNEQNNEMTEVMLWHDCLGPNFVSIKELSRMNLEGAIPHGSVVIAMRRIIQEPKRWTVEDHKAGRLPPAGSKYLVGMHNIELECLYNDPKGNAWGFDAQGEVYGFAIKYCSPIETPEEKAERLRSEWCSECTSKYYPRGHKGFPEMIYDALLSGTLSVPTKGGE